MNAKDTILPLDRVENMRALTLRSCLDLNLGTQMMLLQLSVWGVEWGI